MSENITYTVQEPISVQTPQLPAQHRLPFAIVLAIVLMFGVGGFTLGVASKNPLLSSSPIIPLSVEEQKDGVFSRTMTATEISIHILPVAEYQAHNPKTLAVTYMPTNPCRIEIPEGWEIIANIESKKVMFNDIQNFKTLVHEILHCYAGDWHGK